MKKSFLAIAMLAALCTYAQLNTPITSPPATITQKVGIMEAKIEYNRPSARGRKVFGDVVPFDQPWRTGANAPTKITFSDSVIIGGKKIAGGTYAFYTIPGQKEWTIILGKNPTKYAWDHKEEDDAVRFKVASETLPYNVESFTIEFANLGRFTADVVLKWETTSVKFPIENDGDKKIMAEIKSKIESVDLYWQSANYYFDNNKDLKQALEWINKVVEKNPQFWTYHAKAKIHSKLGDCKAAGEAAKRSTELAKAAKNEEYVKMNEKLIAECKSAK